MRVWSLLGAATIWSRRSMIAEVPRWLRKRFTKPSLSRTKSNIWTKEMVVYMYNSSIYNVLAQAPDIYNLINTHTMYIVGMGDKTLLCMYEIHIVYIDH